jgi:broad specificity phosphatase PhoE
MMSSARRHPARHAGFARGPRARFASARRAAVAAFACVGVVTVCALAGAANAADPLPLSELKPGRALLLRHALAPGTGDPPGFRLGGCATQRNLDATGRAQAAELGARFAQAGVRSARVDSSQWCRCLETARLLGLGPVREQPALNSFFGRSSAERAERIAALRALLAALPVDGPPVVLVTHQVVIAEFSGRATASGAGTLFELNGTGSPKALGDIAAP